MGATDTSIPGIHETWGPEHRSLAHPLASVRADFDLDELTGTDDSSALAALDATWEYGLPHGVVYIGTDTTVEAGIFALHGSGFYIADGVTLTLAALFRGSPSKHFYGPGTVAFTGATEEMLPEWWGAEGDGTTDDAEAAQAAIDAAGAAGARVVFGRRTYVIGTTISYTDGAHLVIRGTLKAGVGVRDDSQLIQAHGVSVFINGGGTLDGDTQRTYSYNNRASEADSDLQGATNDILIEVTGNCPIVRITDLTLLDAGKDGIYIGQTSAAPDEVPQNVVIDVTAKRCHRGNVVLTGFLDALVRLRSYDGYDYALDAEVNDKTPDTTGRTLRLEVYAGWEDDSIRQYTPGCQLVNISNHESADFMSVTGYVEMDERVSTPDADYDVAISPFTIGSANIRCQALTARVKTNLTTTADCGLVNLNGVQQQGLHVICEHYGSTDATGHSYSMLYAVRSQNTGNEDWDLHVQIKGPFGRGVLAKNLNYGRIRGSIDIPADADQALRIDTCKGVTVDVEAYGGQSSAHVRGTCDGLVFRGTYKPRDQVFDYNGTSISDMLVDRIVHNQKDNFGFVKFTGELPTEYREIDPIYVSLPAGT